MILLSSACCIQAIAYTQVTVKVPYSNEVVNAATDIPELSEETISLYNTAYGFFGGELWDDATALYNCHSFAWYSRDYENNRYWISDPTNFYYNEKYEEVTTPRIGDIVCYFDDRGTENPDDDANLHSGVVMSVVTWNPSGTMGGLDSIVVISKWGKAGLYRHNGYRCPYTAYKDVVEDEHHINYGIDEAHVAEYVKFYRAHQHQEEACDASGILYSCSNCDYEILVSHSCTYQAAAGNLFTHTATCSECSFSYAEAHNWVDLRTRYQCGKCGLISRVIPATKASLPADLLKALEQKLSTNQAVCMVDAQTALCCIDGQYYLVKADSETVALNFATEYEKQISESYEVN